MSGANHFQDIILAVIFYAHIRTTTVQSREIGPFSAIFQLQDLASEQGAPIRIARWPGTSVKDAWDRWRFCHWPDQATVVLSEKFIMCTFFYFKNSSILKAFKQDATQFVSSPCCTWTDKYILKYVKIPIVVSNLVTLAMNNLYLINAPVDRPFFVLFQPISVQGLHAECMQSFSKMPFVWKY